MPKMLFSIFQALVYQLSKYIMIMWFKCDGGCEKIQLGHLLGKNEKTFRTTQYYIKNLDISGKQKNS